jgi:hypothetical protein
MIFVFLSVNTSPGGESGRRHSRSHESGNDGSTIANVKDLRRGNRVVVQFDSVNDPELHHPLVTAGRSRPRT